MKEYNRLRPPNSHPSRTITTVRETKWAAWWTQPPTTTWTCKMTRRLMCRLAMAVDIARRRRRQWRDAQRTSSAWASLIAMQPQISSRWAKIPQWSIQRARAVLAVKTTSDKSLTTVLPTLRTNFRPIQTPTILTTSSETRRSRSPTSSYKKK